MPPVPPSTPGSSRQQAQVDADPSSPGGGVIGGGCGGCSGNGLAPGLLAQIPTVGGLGSEARFQVKKSACFWSHGRYHE